MAKQGDGKLTFPDVEEISRERIDRLSDWVWEIDTAGVCTYSNRAVQNLLGYSPDELLGKSPRDLLTVEDNPEYEEALDQARTMNVPVANLISHVRGKDTVKIIQTSCMPLRDTEDHLAGFRCLSRDVTESKRTEHWLLKLNECLLSFGPDPLENIGRLVALYGGLLGATCALYNRLVEEMLCSWAQWNTPPDYNPIDNPEGHICYDVIQRGGDQPTVIHNLLQTDYARTDPNLRLYELQTYVGIAVRFAGESVGSLCAVFQGDFQLSDNDLRLTQLIASAIAVEEERKHTEDTLKETETKYRNLVEESIAGVYILRETTFAYVNPAFANIFKYTQDEIAAGKTASDLAAPASRKLVNENIRKRTDGEIDVIHYCFKGLRKDGKVIDVEVTGARTVYEGKPAIIGSLVDVSERRHAEEARIRLECHFENQQREFYRNTILSVTDGKLEVCDASDIKPYISSHQTHTDVHDASEVTEARHWVQKLCEQNGLKGERLEQFMIGVGEAITNSIKHGVRGRVYAGLKDRAVWVGVSDTGHGIESLMLPKATLLRGFSTKPSLGLGYSIMLDVADRLLLKTNEHGTTVILIKNLEELSLIVSADRLPDTWDNLDI